MVLPSAILEIFPIIPTTRTTSTPTFLAARRTSPTKSPISMKAISGRWGRSLWAKRSLLPPVVAAISKSPFARATPTAWTTLMRKALVE